MSAWETIIFYHVLPVSAPNGCSLGRLGHASLFAVFLES